MADQDVDFNNIITGDENLNNFLGNENSNWKKQRKNHAGCFP
jgi:hypothetical protein